VFIQSTILARCLAVCLGLAVLLPAPSLAEASRRKRRRAPSSPHRVKALLLGDSLVATELGAYLQDTLRRQFRASCRRRGRSSSGLARPDFYHWPRVARRATRRHRPDLVFVLLGTNDGQNMRPRLFLQGRWRRRWVRWATPAWELQYRKQIKAMLESLDQPGRQLIWLSVPPMANRWMDRRLERIRELQREVVEREGRHALYLDIYSMLRPSDRRGYRRLRRYRHRDGVHFNWRGSRRLVHRVYPLLATTLTAAMIQRYLQVPAPAHGRQLARR
jgi:hypothetical protein